jgi:L-ascorbate metabolism protein UlaG (beta-lactamase superfamily)
VVPMHFGTFPALTGTPQQLADLVRDTGCEVWKLTPGETVEW